MTLGWEESLVALLSEVEGWSDVESLERVCVIRDLRGQIRLAIRPKKPIDLAALETRLALRLGGWFAPPILATNMSSLETQRLARGLIERTENRWPDGWPKQWSDGLNVRFCTPDLWCGERRVRSKDAWLHRGEVRPPWPLLVRTPAVVSFYSFKGGVGRTTTLGILARLLAYPGRHVAILDLDLEAPGLGRFFDIETERGLLDLLAEYHATGSVDVETLRACRRTLDVGEGRITVYPVGAMSSSYIERLASLDFTPQVQGANPVEMALRAVLKALRADHDDLEYILLDARAGLHDLGGLSLHALSHVDVIIGRAGRATLDGFSLVLQALARRRMKTDLRVVVAQTFLPLPLDGEMSRSSHEGWTIEMFEKFQGSVYERLYAPDESLPAVMAPDAMHHPWPIPQYDSIARADRLAEIDETVLDARPFTALATRIAELCLRPPLSVTEGEEQFDDDEDDEDDEGDEGEDGEGGEGGESEDEDREESV
jgi:cellulose biosynthesis protein BcsQ